jgi:hypothetical protein
MSVKNKEFYADFGSEEISQKKCTPEKKLDQKQMLFSRNEIFFWGKQFSGRLFTFL